MMQISEVAVSGYRSLRGIRFPVRQLSVFVGANGVGKTNLYRALQLLQAAAGGDVEPRTVIKQDGATWIEGLKLFGEFGDDDDDD